MTRSSILALPYNDGIAADLFLSELGYRLRDGHVGIAGLVQHNKFVRSRARCDMELEELSSGRVVQLSEDRGAEARGCRLDRAALSAAAAMLLHVFGADEKPELLIVNKFGKVEAEGGGLRDVIASAVSEGVPVVVGVPFRNLDQWRIFAGEFADECSYDKQAIYAWLGSQGVFARIDPDQSASRDVVRLGDNSGRMTKG